MNKDSFANKLVREILARIFTGEYAIDSRLPPERAWAIEFSISRGTVRQALGILAELGVIAIRRGSGVYVQGLSQSGILTDYLPRGIARVNLEDILSPQGHRDSGGIAGLQANIGLGAQRTRKTDRRYGGEF